MKVTTRSSTALVIRDSSALMRIMGAFFVLFGALFVGIASQGAVSLWEHTVPAIVGVLFILTGILTMVLPSTQTFVFDKAQRLLTITREAAFRKPVKESVQFRDIAAIDLERSGDIESGALFRVALVLADGARRPWTSYYRSGGTQMRAVVETVRHFLELEAPAVTNTAVRLVAVIGAAQRRSSAWLLGASIVFCLVFLGIGARLLWVQEARLMRYTPVPVTIDAARIDEITDSEGTPIYRPVVLYHYELGGQRYTGDRVTPLNNSGGQRWAAQRVASYRIGRTYTAYHDPSSPGESFLSRERAVLPYLFVAVPMFGLIVCAIGIAGLRKTRS